jgi:hypothetical protein
MSPEQAEGLPLDARSDVFSLGCLLYRLLTGSSPFTGNGLYASLKLLASHDPPPPHEVNPEIPRAVSFTVMALLEKDRNQRAASAIEVLEPLRALERNPFGLRLKGIGSVLRAMIGRIEQPLVRQRAVEPPRVAVTRVAAPATFAAVANPLPLPEPVRSAPNTAVAHALIGPGELTTRKKRPVRRWLLSLLIAVVLIEAGVLAYALWWRSGPEYALPPLMVDASENDPVLFVTSPRWWLTPPTFRSSKDPSKPFNRPTYRTIASALEAAKDGDRILLLDDTISETLDLSVDSGPLPARITIEGRTAQDHPVWRGSPDQRNKPILSLNGVKNWTIKGCIFDGESARPDVMVVRGHCPGLKLVDLRIGAYRNSGLVLRGCSGETEPEDRIIVSGVRIQEPAAGASAALLLDAGEAAETRNITIRDCRLEGPAKAAVQITGAASLLELRHARIYRFTDGLRFTPSPDKGKTRQLRVSIVSNTLGECETALRLESLPAVDKEQSRIFIKDNLLWKVPKTFVADAKIDASTAKNLFSQFEGNIQDPSSGQPPTWLPQSMRMIDFPPLPTDKDDDLTFLRYPRTSPLASAGPSGVPVGAPPAP